MKQENENLNDYGQQIGQEVLVKENDWYEGPDMAWTEIMEPDKLEAGTTIYHWSSGIPGFGGIPYFQPKVTCFFKEPMKINDGHCYCFTADEDIPCETDGNEIRIELEEGMHLIYQGYWERGEDKYDLWNKTQ
jgi:hypothetical protein